MSKPTTLPKAEIERLDQIYREGGLRVMASPHVHHDEPTCPHTGCGHRMEWIDFKLELHGDPEHIDKPLVRAWWDGTGFAGLCPSCGGWVRFTTHRHVQGHGRVRPAGSRCFPRTGPISPSSLEDRAGWSGLLDVETRVG